MLWIRIVRSIAIIQHVEFFPSHPFTYISNLRPEVRVDIKVISPVVIRYLESGEALQGEGGAHTKRVRMSGGIRTAI